MAFDFPQWHVLVPINTEKETAMRIKILVFFGFVSLGLCLFGVFQPNSQISHIAVPTAIVYILLSTAFFVSKNEKKYNSDEG